MASCLWHTRDRQTNIINICSIFFGCDIPGIDKQISSTFVASFSVSVGALCENLRIAHANVRLWCSGSMWYYFIDMHEQRGKIVGWWWFRGGSVSDAAGGRCIGCQIGRTSPWRCFTWQGSGSVVLWRKCEKRSFESWLLRQVWRHDRATLGCL